MRRRIFVACLGLGAVVAGVVEAISADPQAVRWLEPSAEAFRQARDTGRPVLVYIASPGCGYCRKMERDTWSDPAVVGQVTRDFIPLKVNADRHPEWLERYRLEGLPALVVLSPTGETILRVEGYQTSRRMLRYLEHALVGTERKAAR